jgi:hypothetical protein
MSAPTDNETWVIDAGDLIVRKRAGAGPDSLTPWERLVYCLWVADYGMRNAGDLETAQDLYPDFHSEARRLATYLSLPETLGAFLLDMPALPGDGARGRLSAQWTLPRLNERRSG